MSPLVARSHRPALWAALVGVCASVVFVSGMVGVSVPLFATLLAVAVLAQRPRLSAQARIWFAVFLAISAIWAFRSSLWLLVPAVAALAIGLALVSLANIRSTLDLAWGVFPRWVIGAVVATTRGLPVLGTSAISAVPAPASERSFTVLRALVVTLPVVSVLALLLASADPLFAALFRPHISADSLPLRVALFMFGIGVFALTWKLPAAAVARDAPDPSPRLGRTEAVVLLGGVCALFAVFTAVQVAAAKGVGLELLRDRGVLVSDYARQGYFQLLAVVFLAVVILVVVHVARSGSGQSRRWERALSALLVALTLAVLVSAMSRLLLYVDAFGLTMLRLACFPGALWMTSLLLLVALWVLGVAPGKAWLPGTAIITLLVTLGLFAAVNPEALVARYNTTTPSAAGPDVRYLARLSDDAIPTLVDAMPSLSPADQAYLRSALCRRQSSELPWQTWSLSRDRAQAALRELCPPAGVPSVVESATVGP